MSHPIQLTKTSVVVRTFPSLAAWVGCYLVPLGFAWLALTPMASAVSPPPPGGYPIGNTAAGDDALFFLTSGVDNTAIGNGALFGNTTGNSNTGNGFFALFTNATGSNNTANGTAALYNNRANNNTANGYFALFSNTTGYFNTANGLNALYGNMTGVNNTANGLNALFHNNTGSNNTADGLQALLNNTTGSANIAVGTSAGFNLTTGSNNIDIGNLGLATESGMIRIGTKGAQTGTFIAGISGVAVAGGVGVVVDTNGHLGTVVSSARYKDDVRPMDKASEAILALEPVTFRYKHNLDPSGIPQFGLVAEQVEKVSPDLVARDDHGRAYTVRYEAVNAMLLNEFLKEHRRVEEQDRRVQELETTVAQLKLAELQQRDLRATVTRLQAALMDQAAQIERVNKQIELSKPVLQVVADSQPN